MSRNFLTPLALTAGTTSAAPLLLQSGTNLTTAAAGAIEYDGKVIYSTPAGRGVSPSLMTYRLNSDLAGANSTASQSIFGVGLTVQSDTIYAINMVATLGKTAGGSTHSFDVSLDSGTATFNNMAISGHFALFQAIPPTTSTLATTSVRYGIHTTSASLRYLNNIGAGTRTGVLTLDGTFSVDAGGTFTPHYKLSVAPGGAYSTLSGSYISIWPIGTAGSNTSVGPWV